jgi:hypothetical protein
MLGTGSLRMPTQLKGLRDIMIKKISAARRGSSTDLIPKVAVDDQYLSNSRNIFRLHQNQAEKLHYFVSDNLRAIINEWSKYPSGYCPRCGGYQP